MADDRYYKPGSFYRICDRTGFKVRAEDTRKQWDGTIVRARSWEPRQPQDFVRGVADQQAVPDARPRPGDRFIEIPILMSSPSFYPDNDPSAQVVPIADGDGPPIVADNGQYILRDGGLLAGEVAPVDPSKYPKSA